MSKKDEHPGRLDATDRAILEILQRDCKTTMARVSDAVRLSAGAVTERIRKLEARGLIRGYHALLDSRLLDLDITAFIGVSIDYPRSIGNFEAAMSEIPDILECHHITGRHTLLLKVKTRNTSRLEAIISRMREIEGVSRTETMVALSTRFERTVLPIDETRPL